MSESMNLVRIIHLQVTALEFLGEGVVMWADVLAISQQSVPAYIYGYVIFVIRIRA